MRKWREGCGEGRRSERKRVRERLRAGPWGTAIFKERGGHYRKATKKTKKEQAKIRRDGRRGWYHLSQGWRALERRRWPALWCELDLARRSFPALG